MVQGYSNAAIARMLKLSRKSWKLYNVIYQNCSSPTKEGIHARVKATLLYLERLQHAWG